MNYLTVKEIAAQWEVSTTLVSRYCAENKIPGAKKEKGKWLIPDDAQKPIDGRRKIEEKEPEFKFVDLFCGVGGFHSCYEACPKNCIPMLLDAVADPKYYVPDELVAVLDIWEEFLQNVKGVKSPFWLHKAGLGIYDDEQYKNDPVIGYQDMPDWKKEMVWRTRVMYNNNHEFIDDWAKRHKMTERSLIHQKFEWNASRDCTTIKQGITQFRQSGVRVKNPDYFPSLVAMNNTPIVWDTTAERYRYLSPHEAAKLQSFKDDFIFNESDPVSYRQLGNSVNVKLVKYTSLSNVVIEKGIHNRRFSYLGKRSLVQKEHSVEGYKADLYIPQTKTIVEIKSVLSEKDEAVFPTVFSERTQNQLIPYEQAKAKPCGEFYCCHAGIHNCHRGGRACLSHAHVRLVAVIAHRGCYGNRGDIRFQSHF